MKEAERLRRQKKIAQDPLPGPSGAAAAQIQGELSDAELVVSVSALMNEPDLAKPVELPKTSTRTAAAVRATPGEGAAEVFLPKGWKDTMEPADYDWISKTFFFLSLQGKVVFDISKVDHLWWSPPAPPVVCNQPPCVSRFFATKLLTWMPRRLFKMRLNCPQTGCKEQELKSSGIYHHLRQVLDIDGYYLLAGEYLECPACKKKVISWNSGILDQLPLGYRNQFPALLTYQYAYDMRVVRLLRQRGLGNSSTQLHKTLLEQHSEAWHTKVLYYLSHCEQFVSASTTRGLVTRPALEEPPQLPSLPRPAWLLQAYCVDVAQRLSEVKAKITSTFGTVLKIDSTKKVAKKLAGQAAATAFWCTNVGNEHGQVLVSVLTDKEGQGIQPMVDGIIRRYAGAAVPPPSLIYTDRDCCPNSGLRRMFSAWPETAFRLDIWHYMRRFTICCTSDAHPLFQMFLGRLSQCIFEYSAEDVEALLAAKRSEMQLAGLPSPSSDADVMEYITKKELALHCRRRTRGADVTRALIEELLVAFDGPQGRDSLGVPLFHTERLWAMWDSQKRHVDCIQDPENFRLYKQTGSLTKGHQRLPTYRCARGSTSLESFHLHLNRFIPGTSANHQHFQLFLLEGLMRWNDDQDAAACGTADPATYSGLLRRAANRLSTTVFGKKLHPTFRPPRAYTGELLGIEYLFAQTGKTYAVRTQDPDSDEESGDEDDEDFDEGFGEDPEDETMTPISSLPATGAIKSPYTRVSIDSTKRLRPPVPLQPQPTSLSSKPTQCLPPLMPLQPQPASLSSKPIKPLPMQPLCLGASTSSTISECRPPSSDTDQTEDHDLSSESDEECVGPDNAPGYRKVEKLVDFLFDHRESTSPHPSSSLASPDVQRPAIQGPAQQFIYILPKHPVPASFKRQVDQDVPRSTICYRRKKEAEEAKTGLKRRKYQKQDKPRKPCSFCQQPKTGPVHSQIRGNWFCPQMGITKDEWTQQMKAKYNMK